MLNPVSTEAAPDTSGAISVREKIGLDPDPRGHPPERPSSADAPTRMRSQVNGCPNSAAGASVTQVGIQVGYESTSAYVAAFRRLFGRSPGKYFAPVEPSAPSR
ncbi:MAG: helix-turn-helix domain-containing protein [Gemmatimonadota bacterium]